MAKTAKRWAVLAVCCAMGIAVFTGTTHAALWKKKEKTASAPAAPEKKTAEEVLTACSQLEKEHTDLKRQFEELEADRNNVLAQTRILLAEKSTYVESKDSLTALKKQHEEMSSDKQKLHEELRNLKQRFESTVLALDQLKTEHDGIRSKLKGIQFENDQLIMALGEKAQKDPEYQKMSKELSAIRDEKRKSDQAAKAVEANLRKALEHAKKLSDREAKLKEDINNVRGRLSVTEAERNNLAKENREISQHALNVPQKFKSLAEENRVLVKESADMHYNLGVLFTENRRFPQAMREYERALDIDPNNAKVHYNLGYLYADQLNRHDEAVGHFKQFLRLQPQSKESERVRKYLLARETYSGSYSENIN